MLGRSNCCAPQKTCFNNTYDDYEELSQKGGGKNGYNTCRPSFKENLCNRIKRVQESSKILESVLDISSTLVKIMCVCGIHECKANKALDVIIYAFMHFDEVSEHPGGKCKKRIRKEEFYNDLMRDCSMTKAEAKLTYSIVKCAFKAFYHKQVVNKYDAGFVDECEWKNAANRTINIFAESGASKSEVELTGKRILCAFENYMCRLQSKRHGKSKQDENKCVCSRGKKDSHGFGNGAQEFDPCQPFPPPCYPCPPPCPPEPPLCGELCCQIVCPPGATRPQLVCKDVCGRTFLRVDGNKVNFDPFVMECEAKRAAMQVCPPSDADRIKSLRQSLDVCGPQESDSCDRILAEICNENEEEESGDICDEEGEIYDKEEEEVPSVGGGGDAPVPVKQPSKRVSEKRGREERGREERGRVATTKKFESLSPETRSLSSPRHETYSIEEVMSITVKFKKGDGGSKMEVDMQGYGPEGTRAPDNIHALRVIANDNAPLDFECKPLSDHREARSVKSHQQEVKSIKEQPTVLTINEDPPVEEPPVEENEPVNEDTTPIIDEEVNGEEAQV